MRVLWASSDDSGAAPEESRSLTADCGCSVETAFGAFEAIEAIRSCAYDAVVGEFPMPGWTDEEWLEEIRRIDPNLPVIIRCAHGSCHDAVRLTKLGAYHFLGEGSTGETVRIIEEALEQHRIKRIALDSRLSDTEPWKQLMVGESRPMKNIGRIVQMVAPRRSTVLITGETGTGKEIVARSIHMASGRGQSPLIAVNCNALPEALLEGELFGHVKGAFTGAISNRIGRFEQANHSTLFLDEIGDMPLDLQSKLLRVIQERELQRLGSSETLRLDVRIIAASNAVLAERVRDGRFREDLYYRLNVVPIVMPPLRERPGDVPLLVHHFIEKICRLESIPVKRITQAALDRLCTYSWPGNVRQLENAVETAIALTGDEPMLTPADFPLPPAIHRTPVSATPTIRLPDCGLDFEGTVSGIERSILEQALKRTRGNKKLAAEMLRLKRTTLSAKLKSLAAAAA
jgi:DNA-binding NtrC family response regulator